MLRLKDGLESAAGWTVSAALFATSHNGGMQTFPKTGGHIVNLVRTVDLYRFAGSAKRDLAVFASSQVLLEVGAHFGGDRVVDQIIEQGEKLSAGHFSTPTSLEPFFLRK